MTFPDVMTAARFWSKVDVRRPGECWPWRRALNEHGYGIFRRSGEKANIKAHRMARELATGEQLPPEVKVLHSCDNPPCCNPAHLSPGTQGDNIADMVSKGRQKGSRHSKLSPEQVDEIHAQLARGATQASLAEQLGISQSYISMIAAGKRWRSEEAA